jgi:hypothetical protein
VTEIYHRITTPIRSARAGCPLIATLGAEGLTNRTIAGQLLLGPRTVDHHPDKVFTKLGIASPRELVRNVPMAGPVRSAAAADTEPTASRPSTVPTGVWRNVTRSPRFGAEALTVTRA